MIHITLDLGNLPSVLAALSSPSIAQRVASAAAESYNDDVHDWIDAGRGFTPQYGHLQQAVNWRPVGNGAAEVYIRDQTFRNYNQKLDYAFDANPAGYAWFVEHGSGPHVIGPKAGRKGIKIPVSGGDGYILRRSANHPGSRARPFFYADQAGRSQRIQARALSVLASAMGSGQ